MYECACAGVAECDPYCYRPQDASSIDAILADGNGQDADDASADTAESGFDAEADAASE
jgi:hypothetical protein